MIQSVFVMLTVAFLAFSLFRFVGDPITQMTGVETSVEDQERLREELGLNDPFVYQFTRFTGDMLKGDFGFSYRTRQPVAEMIASRIPATFRIGRGRFDNFASRRYPCRGLHSAEATRRSDTNHLDDNSCGRVDSDICDWDHVDLYFWRAIRLAPHIRTRRYGSNRWLGKLFV